MILETLERSGTCTLGELASSLDETDHVDSFETAELVLHHAHIPALVDVGAVRYDEHSRVVTAEFQTLTVE